MSLPQKNAVLTAITAAGGSEDDGGAYTDPAGSAKWTGAIGAYVHEEVLAVAGETGLNEARQTFIVIPEVNVSIIPEDTATFTYKGTARTRIIRHVEAHTLPGHLKTIRLYFRDT